LFAASAYLSKEPRMLGSLKGQDAGKGIAIVFILPAARWPPWNPLPEVKPSAKSPKSCSGSSGRSHAP